MSKVVFRNLGVAALLSLAFANPSQAEVIVYVSVPVIGLAITTTLLLAKDTDAIQMKSHAAAYVLGGENAVMTPDLKANVDKFRSENPNLNLTDRDIAILLATATVKSN